MLEYVYLYDTSGSEKSYVNTTNNSYMMEYDAFM